MKNRPNFPLARSAGLSLIELMIAMVIGLILLLGLVQVMTASSAAYKLSAGVARTQENARFAMDFLQRDLRMAGHMGCVSDQAHMAPMMPASSDATRDGLNLWFLTQAQRTARNFAALSGDNAPLRFDLGIQGFEAAGTSPGEQVVLTTGAPVVGDANDWEPGLPAPIAALRPVEGSDILVIRYLSTTGVPVSIAAANASSYTMTPEAYGVEVSVNNPTGLFGVADCKQASVFAATAVDAGSGAVTASVGGLNSSGLLGDEWSLEGGVNQPMLYPAEVVVYYVGVGAGTGADGNSPPSLFRARLVAPAAGGLAFRQEELVEGVESLQLLYGMDEALPANLPRGNITRTRSAEAVANVTNPNNAQGDLWRRVGTVQVGLLMRSADRAVADQAETAPMVLGLEMRRGADDDAQDSYYRSVYESTIALRNRLFGN